MIYPGEVSLDLGLAIAELNSQGSYVIVGNFFLSFGSAEMIDRVIYDIIDSISSEIVLRPLKNIIISLPCL